MRVVNCCFLIVLFIAFFVFGLWLMGNLAEKGLVEVFGYDYATFMSQMRDVRWITYTGFRHPGLGLVLSPFVLIASLLSKFGDSICDYFILAVMSGEGVLNAWLVKRIGGWIAVVMFLVFPFSWILAAVPESFPFAMTSLLLVALLANHESRYSVAAGRKRCDLMWLLLFALATAITITNGLKVVVAYLICHWRSLKNSRFMFYGYSVPVLTALIVGCVCVITLGYGFFALRMARWNAMHPDEPKTLAMALSQTIRWIPVGLGVVGRAKSGCLNFIATPISPVAGFADLSRPAVPSLVGWAWSYVVCMAAVVSAVVNWRTPLVRVMVGMFSVDLLIHVVCGWGLMEGWIFCAHWFWMLPVLVGQQMSKNKLHPTND